MVIKEVLLDGGQTENLRVKDLDRLLRNMKQYKLLFGKFNNVMDHLFQPHPMIFPPSLDLRSSLSFRSAICSFSSAWISIQKRCDRRAETREYDIICL